MSSPNQDPKPDADGWDGAVNPALAEMGRRALGRETIVSL